MPYDEMNPFDPVEETRKRDEFLAKIKGFWNQGMTPQELQAMQQRDQQMRQSVKNLISPLTGYLQGLGGGKAPQGPGQVPFPSTIPDFPQQPPAPPPQQAQVADQGYAPQGYGGTPMGPPAPPPPPRAQAPQDMGGTPGVDPAAYMQQREEDRRNRYMQMIQFINSLSPKQDQPEKKPTMREKAKELLPLLSSGLTQFGGAMMSPPWMRGQAMANIGQTIPSYLAKRAQQKEVLQNKREAQKEQQQYRMLSLLPHLMQAQEGKETQPHFLVGQDGKVQMFPGPVAQEKSNDPKSYQAAAIYYRERGDNDRADYYDQMYRQAENQRLAIAREHLRLQEEPETIYEPDTGKTVTVPRKTKVYRPPQEKQGGVTNIPKNRKLTPEEASELLRQYETQ